MGTLIIASFEGIRVLIDPDDPARKSSEVRTYHLSPEEIEARYGKPNPIQESVPVYKQFERKQERERYLYMEELKYE